MSVRALTASRALSDTVQALQNAVPLIIKEYNQAYPNRCLRVVSTLRTTKEQQALYAEGRTTPPLGKKYWVTQIDGVHKFSKHNPDPAEPKAKAVDFGVFVGGKYITSNTFYYPLLGLARKYNLVSGLDFFKSGKTLEVLLKDGHFHDVPHIEVPGPIYEP